MRSPRRRWNASSTASFTSLVSAGSAVWLSKGRMATVLMFGRPPPAKPYRQPRSARASALTAPAPNRRVEHRGRVHRDHRKLKPSPFPRKIHAGARRQPLRVEFGAAARQHLALSPPLRLEHARAAARLAVVERVPVRREPPDPDARIGPPHPPPPPPPRNQGGPARRPPRTQGPPPPPPPRGQRLRHQRRGLARAAGQQRTGGNVGECYPRVKRKMLRSQELNPAWE